MSSEESAAFEIGTVRPVDLPHPKTEERMWQATRQYLAAHPLEPSATPGIPIRTAAELIPLIHGACTAEVNDALQLGQTALPDFPFRNLVETNDDDNVLWHYYRSGHACRIR